MAFAGLNILGVIAAAIAGFAVGAAYYMALGKQWMAAAGLTEKDVKGDGAKTPSPAPFIVAGVTNLLLATMLAGLAGHIGALEMRPMLISAFFVWLGIMVGPMATNYAFQGRPARLTIIDAGHWLAVLLAQGIALSLFGV